MTCDVFASCVKRLAQCTNSELEAMLKHMKECRPCELNTRAKGAEYVARHGPIGEVVTSLMALKLHHRIEDAKKIDPELRG